MFCIHSVGTVLNYSLCSVWKVFFLYLGVNAVDTCMGMSV
jgi:hypothetical protein